jgi:hypothetical protein
MPRRCRRSSGTRRSGRLSVPVILSEPRPCPLCRLAAGAAPGAACLLRSRVQKKSCGAISSCGTCNNASPGSISLHAGQFGRAEAEGLDMENRQ